MLTLQVYAIYGKMYWLTIGTFKVFWHKQPASYSVSLSCRFVWIAYGASLTCLKER